MFEAGYATWIADPTHKAENDQLTNFLASNITTVEGKQAPSAQFTTFSASLAFIDYWRSRLADLVTQATAQPNPDQQGVLSSSRAPSTARTTGMAREAFSQSPSASQIFPQAPPRPRWVSQSSSIRVIRREP